SEPRSKAQKEDLAALVASQRLHGGIVDDLHGTTECLCKIEPDPSASEVVWFGNRPAVENRPGIADRDPVIRPPSGELLDSRQHPPGGQGRPGWKGPPFGLSGGKDLDRSSAHIDDQHLLGRERLCDAASSGLHVVTSSRALE